MIESALFGHVKGAFTGASSDNTGRFELADGGTIFLDEIGELPLPLQTKLLRVPIRIPPLRDRTSDIPLLVWAFIKRNQARLGRTIEDVAPETMASLRAHDWPGNVRELQNVMERALIRSTGPELNLAGVHERPGPAAADDPRDAPLSGWGPSERLVDMERHHILGVLEGCGGRIKGTGNAAERLGLPPSTLRFRMKKLGIERPRANRDASTTPEHLGD